MPAYIGQVYSRSAIRLSRQKMRRRFDDIEIPRHSKGARLILCTPPSFQGSALERTAPVALPHTRVTRSVSEQPRVRKTTDTRG